MKNTIKMKKRKNSFTRSTKMLALAAIAGLSFGCATLLDVTSDVCETALGGSKVGDALCDKIDVLKSEDSVVE